MTPQLRDDLADDLRLVQFRDLGESAESLAAKLRSLGWTKPLPVVRRLREERDEARAEVARLRQVLDELPFDDLRDDIARVVRQFRSTVSYLSAPPDPDAVYPVAFAASGSVTFDSAPPVVGSLGQVTITTSPAQDEWVPGDDR